MDKGINMNYKIVINLIKVISLYIPLYAITYLNESIFVKTIQLFVIGMICYDLIIQIYFYLKYWGYWNE